MKRHILMAIFVILLVTKHEAMEKAFMSFVHNLQSGTLVAQSDTPVSYNGTKVE